MGDDFFIIVALGDSLTYGYRTRDPYALDPRVPYPAQLEAMLRERLNGRKQAFVINAGVNGDSTEEMLWRFNRAAAAEKPDAIVIWGGINDLSAARDPERVLTNLAKLYESCHGIGSTPIACTLAPTRHTSPAMKRLNDMIKAHTEEKGMILVDLFPALADPDGNLRQEYSDDGAHLTPAGYRRVAEAVLEAVAPLAEKMEP
jgi:lysophospholipase L1-like esterase